MQVVGRWADRVDGWQQRHDAVAVPYAVVKKFGDDNAGTLVSSLAYSAFVALFPLLLILVTVLGIVLSGDPSLRRSVLHSTFGEFPVVGQQLGHNIHALHRASVVGLIVGLVGLLWGSLGLAQTAQFAMAQVWNLPGPARPGTPVRILRGLAFVAVLGSGLVLSTALATFGTFGRHNMAVGLLAELAAVMINIGQYFLAFRVLTAADVETGRLVPGAVAGGVAWTALLAVGGYLVGHDLRNASATYGTFATVLGLVAWVYLGAEISIYAAELNTVLARRLWPRSVRSARMTEADRESLILQVTQNQRRPEQAVTVTFSKGEDADHDHEQPITHRRAEESGPRRPIARR